MLLRSAGLLFLFALQGPIRSVCRHRSFSTPNPSRPLIQPPEPTSSVATFGSRAVGTRSTTIPNGKSEAAEPSTSTSFAELF